MKTSSVSNAANQDFFCWQNKSWFVSKANLVIDSANLFLVSKLCQQFYPVSKIFCRRQQDIPYFASRTWDGNDFSSGRRVSFFYLRLTTYCRTFQRKNSVMWTNVITCIALARKLTVMVRFLMCDVQCMLAFFLDVHLGVSYAKSVYFPNSQNSTE
jgi:hypothetical protein